MPQFIPDSKLAALATSLIDLFLVLFADQRLALLEELLHNDFFCISCGRGSRDNPNPNCDCEEAPF